MVAGIMTIRLSIPDAHSLKDKRRWVRSIKDRVRANFNVSIAEVAAQDVWQTADLAVSAVSSERSVIEGQFNEVLNVIRACRAVVLVRSEREFV